MPAIESFAEKLEDGFAVVIDGALGTELSARGIRLAGKAWSAEALRDGKGRQAIGEIHEEYIRARAEQLTTNTFRTPALGEEAELYTLAACSIARRAREETQEPDVVIAGSAGPVGDCYLSATRPSLAVLREVHDRHAETLAVGGVDLFLAETMNNLAETAIALDAARKVDLPVAVCFYTKNGEDLESGEPLSEGIELAKSFGAVYAGVNCVDLRTAASAIWHLRCTQPEIPIAGYAQGYDPTSPFFRPDLTEEQQQIQYVNQAKFWVERLGAQVVGGCCGVSPAHIKKISEQVALHNQALENSISAPERVD